MKVKRGVAAVFLLLISLAAFLWFVLESPYAGLPAACGG